MGATALGKVQVALEATPGTVIVAKRPVITTGSPKFHYDPKWDEPEEQRGSFAQHFENMQELTHEVQIDMEGEWYPTNCMQMLYLAAATPVVTGAGPYVYTCSADGTHDALKTATFEEFDGTDSWKYPYGYCKELEFTFVPSEALKWKFTGGAQDKVPMGSNPGNNITVLGQPGDIPLVGQSGSVFIDNTGGSFGTTQFGELLDAKIKISTGLVPQWAANTSSLFSRLWRKRRLITVDCTIDFPATATSPGTIVPYTEYWTNFRTNIYRLFQFNITASSSAALVFNIPGKYKTFELDRSKESLTAKVMIESVYDSGAAFDYQIIGTGTAASTTY